MTNFQTIVNLNTAWAQFYDLWRQERHNLPQHTAYKIGTKVQDLNFEISHLVLPILLAYARRKEKDSS